MSQHDFNIANQGFPNFRADLNDALEAIVTTSSGAAAPTTTYPNQFWYDTTNSKLMFRNEADSAWLLLFEVEQTGGEGVISGGGMYKGENGTVGDRSGDIFRINEQQLDTDVTIDASENASCTGPLTVATGITLTVATGGSLVIV